MARDTFIITVYCLVVEHYAHFTAQRSLRHGGFAAQVTDAEVITMEICGEYFKLHTDKDRFAYFHTHSQHFFPSLTDRPQFARQATNLWQLKALIHQRLTQVRGQAADPPVQALDTLPLPVCTYTRSARDRCFKPEADYGHCAAKQLEYDGFKLGLRLSRAGMITHYPVLAARPHDSTHLDALIEGCSGLVPADKGFSDELSAYPAGHAPRPPGNHAGTGTYGPAALFAGAAPGFGAVAQTERNRGRALDRALCGGAPQSP